MYSKDFIKLLMLKIRLLTHQLSVFSYADANVLLAYVLKSMARDYGVKTEQGIKLCLSFTHFDLSYLTGLSRVTVSRILKQYSENGLLHKEKNGSYIICDPEMLDSITAGY